MAKVTVTNNHTSTIELPTPLTGSLPAKQSKIFLNIPMHLLEASKDLQDARNRGLLTLLIEEDPNVTNDVEEASVAEATGGSAAAVAAHSALATGVHGVGGSTVESAAGATAKVGAHNTLATGVHGVGGSTVASAADIGTAVTAHDGIGIGTAHGGFKLFGPFPTVGGPQAVVHGMPAPPLAQAFYVDFPAGPLAGPAPIAMLPSDPVAINWTTPAGFTVVILAWLP